MKTIICLLSVMLIMFSVAMVIAIITLISGWRR